MLVINLFNGDSVSGLVTDDTEIECENDDADDPEDIGDDHGDDGPDHDVGDDHGDDSLKARDGGSGDDDPAGDDGSSDDNSGPGGGDDADDDNGGPSDSSGPGEFGDDDSDGMECTSADLIRGHDGRGGEPRGDGRWPRLRRGRAQEVARRAQAGWAERPSEGGLRVALAVCAATSPTSQSGPTPIVDRERRVELEGADHLARRRSRAAESISASGPSKSSSSWIWSTSSVSRPASASARWQLTIATLMMSAAVPWMTVLTARRSPSMRRWRLPERSSGMLRRRPISVVT